MTRRHSEPNADVSNTQHTQDPPMCQDIDAKVGHEDGGPGITAKPLGFAPYF